LCCFLFGSWKKLIDDSQQSAPFSIFLSNICYANKDRYPSMLYVRPSTFRQNRVKVCAYLLMDYVTQKARFVIAKKIREGFMVFCRTFSNT
jgi:hypothetical protein